MAPPDEQEREWQAIYEGLRALLARHGRDDPYGEGDYWIIDDNWGCCGHKVEVHQPRIVTREVAQGVQNLLRDLPLRNAWYVIFSLAPADPRYRGEAEGIKVTADAIEEHWDRDRLRAELGSDFRWNGG
jgi:hypothetical protein